VKNKLKQKLEKYIDRVILTHQMPLIGSYSTKVFRTLRMEIHLTNQFMMMRP